MRIKLLMFVSMFLAAAFFMGNSNVGVTYAGTNSDCLASSTSSVVMLGSVDFQFTCANAQTVYFGACDSGNVPNDDLFDIRVGGLLVSYNYYVNSVDEFTVMSSYQATAGTHTATLTSLNTTPYPPATYSYISSSNPSEIPAFLSQVCGVDWKGIGSGNSVGCNTDVPIFTQDSAPSDGTLEFHVLLGNEGSFGDEINFATINVNEGDQLNNVTITNVPSPRYVRLWWQPAGSSDWSLLTTQYWHGGGSLADEYGVSCQGLSSPPSYHTQFANGIPEADVCFDLPNGCQ